MKHLVLVLCVTACSGANAFPEDPDKTTSTGESAVCGNAVIDGDEVCDGVDLGGTSCMALPGYVGGTLACASDCSAYDVSACTVDPIAAIVRFNEVTSSDLTDGPYAGAGDAIELYNAGTVEADLSGLKVSDTADFPDDKTYVFPTGLTLAPGAFLVLTRLDDVTGMGDYGFGISGSNPETLRLGDADGAELDTVEVAGGDAEVSWCRVPDGDGEWQACMRTFGSSNLAAGSTDGTDGTPVCGDGVRDGDEACDGDDLADATCESLGDFVGGRLACADDCTFDTDACTPVAPKQPLVLNELCSDGDDAIELYNAGSRTIDLTGWILTDALSSADDDYVPADDPDRLEFEPGATIGAGEFLVIVQGDPPGHPFGLSAGGDHLSLLDPDLVVVDFVEYGADEATISYCRVPDGPFGAWEPNCTATPGEPNAH